MIGLIQRVSVAKVQIEGRTIGEIGRGLMVLVGVEREDGSAEADRLAAKLIAYRVFPDDAGKMNRSVLDTKGEILLVPNFTLAGNAQQGRRPSFDQAMRPEQAEPMFNQLAQMLAERGVPTQTGVFRAHMHVALVNDGPITLVIDA